MKRRPYIGLILILLPCILVFTCNLFSATITSNGTGGGSFRKGATWVGGTPPADGDLTVIAAGDSVWFNADVDTNFTIGNDGTGDLDISGKLTCINSGEIDTLFMKGGISVNNGGSFIIDKSSDGANYFIIVMDCSSDGEHGIVVDDGGIIDWDGAEKLYATYSTSNTASGQADIAVNGDITDWKVGDEIVVEGDVAGETEKLTIQSIASQTVTCTGNFTAQHDSARNVVNLTRNVKFTSSNINYKTYIFNATVIQANFDIQYCSFSRMHNTYLKNGIFMSVGGSGTVEYSAWDFEGQTDTYGLRCDGAGNRNISYNIFYNGGYGIYSKVIGGTISNNYVIKCTYGIGFNDTYGSRVLNNYIFDCTYSFLFFNTTFLSFQDNTTRIAISGDFYISQAGKYVGFTSEDGNHSSSTLLVNQSYIAPSGYLRFSRLNSNNDDYRSYESCGTIRSTGAGLADTEVRTSGSLALKMTPNDTDNALGWEFTVPCVSGEPMALTGYLYCTDRPANASSDIEPSVSISGCGMTEDTYTFTIETDQSEDTWIQWTVSGTPTRNGLATVTVSCYDFSATDPDYYIDDIVVASTAIELGRLDYWYRGLPAPILLSTGIGAMDIWKSLISIDYGDGSMGEGVKNVIRRTPK